MTGEDFTSRFVRHMTIIAGPKFPDGSMANNNRRYKRRVTVERITCPPDHPHLREVRGELRCYR